MYTYTNAAAINRKKSNEFEGELKQVHSMDWRKEKERGRRGRIERGRRRGRGSEKQNKPKKFGFAQVLP